MRRSWTYAYSRLAIFARQPRRVVPDGIRPACRVADLHLVAHVERVVRPFGLDRRRLLRPDHQRHLRRSVGTDGGVDAALKRARAVSVQEW